MVTLRNLSYKRQSDTGKLLDLDSRDTKEHLYLLLLVCCRGRRSPLLLMPGTELDYWQSEGTNIVLVILQHLTLYSYSLMRRSLLYLLSRSHSFLSMEQIYVDIQNWTVNFSKRRLQLNKSKVPALVYTGETWIDIHVFSLKA